MRLSCCAYSYRQYLTSGQMTLERFVEVAREIGCEGVELTAYYFPSTERRYLNELKRFIHMQGLSVSGAAVGSDFAQPDAQNRREHVAMTKAWIDNSVVLGAPTLRVFAGGIREGSSESQAFETTVECLRECGAYAEERGVLLALENHGGITATGDQVLRLLDAVGSEWVGLNLDLGNFTGDVYGQFEQCARTGRTVAAHAKVTWNGPEGKHPVDYGKVVPTMQAAAYRGFLAIEYEEAEDPMEAVPRFAEELRKHLGQ